MEPLSALLALLLASGCDLERPSGQGDCTRERVDRIPITSMQMLGTHNSYKQAIPPGEMALIAAQAAPLARTIDYAHRPLPEQLDAGARQLELDVVHDPQGGLYADPLARRMAGAAAGPYDPAPMGGPGLKVMHVPDIDYRSSCPTFVACLSQVRAWSRAHPDHAPILVLLNLKEDRLPLPGAVATLPFDAAAMDTIDREIRSVFAEAEIITPDQVQGANATLRDAVTTRGWPSLGAARGRVIFALDVGSRQVNLYRGARRSLEGRAAFVNTDEASPAAAYLTLNDPVRQAERIGAAVRAGFLVRTRADADTAQSRANDTSQSVAAFASGAQYISSDYLWPDTRFSPYVVRMPGGLRVRVSPAATSSGR